MLQINYASKDQTFKHIILNFTMHTYWIIHISITHNDKLHCKVFYLYN